VKCNALLNPLTYLKGSIKFKHLEQIYLLPHLEYLFDSGNQPLLHVDKLDQVHYRAALIVSGCMQGSNRTKVLKCLGWMSLGDRRREKKLKLMYDVEQECLPAYVNNAFAEYRNPVIDARLCNRRHHRLPTNVTQRYLNSTIPSAIKQWQNCPNEIKLRISRNSFKNSTRALLNGPKNKLITTKLDMSRIDEINLNKTKCDFVFNAHLHAHSFTHIDNPCPGGNKSQTTQHLFFSCPLFTDLRRSFFNDLGLLPTFNAIHSIIPGLDDRPNLLLNGLGSFSQL
jgi:hypothetical protein